MNIYTLLKLVITIYIISKFIIPISQENSQLLNKIDYLKQMIKKNELFLKQKNEIEDKYKKALEIYKYNQKLFFNQKNDSKIFVKLQKIIQNANKNINFNIKWGIKSETTFLYIYPITIRAKSTPEEIGKFLDSICKYKKIIKIKKIKIYAINKYSIIYTIEVVGYKLKDIN